eukprot:527315-Karenia_brevis.AAC.1
MSKECDTAPSEGAAISPVSGLRAQRARDRGTKAQRAQRHTGTVTQTHRSTEVQKHRGTEAPSGCVYAPCIMTLPRTIAAETAHGLAPTNKLLPESK